ncbi:MAG: response regulator transcription factor [Candidatus Aminicenantes bacterium]|nr:MAG: response regulator transcription factor [Candidatus Aminicenantes bacterium]
MRILIIDDYVDYAFNLKGKFRFAGHEAEYCLNSRTAVEFALKYKPDWVVLDVRMPYKSGVIVYRELKDRLDIEFSVVFYSNHCDDPDIIKEFRNLNVPDEVIIPKTTDMEDDVINKLIPALKSGYFTGGQKNGKQQP